MLLMGMIIRMSEMLNFKLNEMKIGNVMMQMIIEIMTNGEMIANSY